MLPPPKGFSRSFGAVEAALLRDCYMRVLELAREKNLKSIAFPCISTGVYGYPQAEAAEIAVKTAPVFLQGGYVVYIIFCCFSEADLDIYKELLGKASGYPPAALRSRHIQRSVLTE